MANVVGAGIVEHLPHNCTFLYPTPSPTLPIDLDLTYGDYGRACFFTSHPSQGNFSPHHLQASLPDHDGGDMQQLLLPFSFPSFFPPKLTQNHPLLPITHLTQKNLHFHSTKERKIFVSGLKTPTGVVKKVLCQVFKEKKKESIQRKKEKKYVMSSKLNNYFFLLYTNIKQNGGSVWI